MLTFPEHYLNNRLYLFGMAVLLLSFMLGCTKPNSPVADAATAAQGEWLDKRKTERVLLFNGKDLDGWEQTSFGGEGDCWVEAGTIIMAAGDPMTAINLLEDYGFPTDDYEVLVEAKRVEGTDFFATVTFPVGESFCSLVVGGWAGTLIGLSSIDGEDASSNITRTLKKFDEDRWYQIRVRVAEGNISAWIDQEQVVDLDTVGKRITLRGEMMPCRPFGIASYVTTAAIRKIELQRLINEIQ